SLRQTLPKPGKIGRGFARRPAAEKPDHRHRQLLRPRRERPRRRGAAEQQSDALAPFHRPVPPVLRTKGIAHTGTAALRDFEPVDVADGSKSARASRGAAAAHVRFAPIATRLVRCGSPPLCAISRREQMQQIALLLAMEETNQWHRRLLRARNERRCDYVLPSATMNSRRLITRSARRQLQGESEVR